MRQTFRAAAVLAKYFIGLLTAGPFHGDFLKLLFEFVFGQLATLEAIACLDDFFDVEFEDIAPAKLALGSLASSQKNSKPPPTLLQREFDFLADLVVIRDRFLGLAGEWHPDRSHVDENHHGTGWQSAPGLRNTVVAPRGVEHGLERRAGRLLIEQRHAVGVANNSGQLVVVVLLLTFSERYLWIFRLFRGLFRSLAEGQARFDYERIAAVDCGRPGHRSIEITLDLLIQSMEDRLLADGRDAVARRRHDLGGLYRLIEGLGGGAVNIFRPRLRRKFRGLADLLRDIGGNAAEIARQKTRKRMALRIVQHSQQYAELDPVGMRLDFTRLRRQLLNGPRIFFGLTLGRMVDELDVWIGNRDLFEILIHGGAPLLIAPFNFERHLRSTMVLPVDFFFLDNARLVFLGIDLDFEIMGRRPRTGARNDLNRFAGRQLRVHAGGRDADALLPAAHAQPMELGAIEKFGEDARNLLANDAGAVVDHCDPKPVRLAGRLRSAAVRSHLELDNDFG